jgi:hypothetical protein
MSFVRWVIDSLINEDVIDTQFILSDLYDLEISEQERVDREILGAFGDGLLDRPDDSRPMGKRVY